MFFCCKKPMCAIIHSLFLSQEYKIFVCVTCLQWSFGVTCWEIFTFGRVPYSGIRAMSILNMLREGERLERPTNTACSDKMYNKLLLASTLSNISHYIIYVRYEVMSECWSELSGDRPNFTHLVDALLEGESGYLNLCSPAEQLSGEGEQ